MNENWIEFHSHFQLGFIDLKNIFASPMEAIRNQNLIQFLL